MARLGSRSELDQIQKKIKLFSNLFKYFLRICTVCVPPWFVELLVIKAEITANENSRINIDYLRSFEIKIYAFFVRKIMKIIYII